ncbi:MAG: c-type cytochrome [Puniceicoccaceae bacterium]
MKPIPTQSSAQLREQATPYYLFVFAHFALMGVLTLGLWGYGIWRGIAPALPELRMPDSHATTESTEQAEAVAEVAMVPGEQAYQSCIACHGDQAQGNELLKAPALNQLPASYLANQLRKFKNGQRGSHPDDMEGAMMRPMAATLRSESQIREVSTYIAGLASEPPVATLEGDPIRGKSYYAVCASCHGIDGLGNEALSAPSLVGQQDWYLVSSLERFKSGVRGADPEDLHGAQMRPMAATLPDEQAMRDVAAYIFTLHP